MDILTLIGVVLAGVLIALALGVLFYALNLGPHYFDDEDTPDW
jgi:nitrogen fixation-related uncharacterized protein